MNQSGACLDQSHQPVFANWWAPGAVTNNHRRQYVVAVPGTSGGSWQVRHDFQSHDGLAHQQSPRVRGATCTCAATPKFPPCTAPTPTGPRLGSRAFPETSSIIFTVLDEERVPGLLKAIEGSCPDCREALRMILLKVDRML